MELRSISATLRRPATPMLVLAAAFVAAGGAVHLREWLDIYRDVPAVLPGAAVVRIGFPLNALASLVLAGALVGAAFTTRRTALAIAAAALGFQAASLAVLIASRTGTVFGWMETGWSRGASQTRAVEIGALVALTAALGLVGVGSRSTSPRSAH
jgi:hypothetical protein